MNAHAQLAGGHVWRTGVYLYRTGDGMILTGARLMPTEIRPGRTEDYAREFTCNLKLRAAYFL